MTASTTTTMIMAATTPTATTQPVRSKRRQRPPTTKYNGARDRRARRHRNCRAERSWLSAGGVGWPNWISHFGATAWALEFAPEALSKEPSVTPRSVDFVFRRWLCTCPAGPEKPPVASFRVGSRNKGVVFLRVTDSPGCPWPP